MLLCGISNESRAENKKNVATKNRRKVGTESPSCSVSLHIYRPVLCPSYLRENRRQRFDSLHFCWIRLRPERLSWLSLNRRVCRKGIRGEIKPTESGVPVDKHDSHVVYEQNAGGDSQKASRKSSLFLFCIKEKIYKLIQ